MIFLQGSAPSGFGAKLINWDYKAFSLINQRWHNGTMDTLAPFFREANTWIPFYFFILLFVVFNFGKRSVWWIVSFLITAGLSDIISAHLIKNSVFRLRPCRDPEWAEQVRFLVNYCPMSSSFVSSHASNHFAMAAFLFFTLGRISKWWWFAFAWAFLVAYSQIYVGVHFPLDVFCGAVVGYWIGFTTAWFFNNKVGMLSLATDNRTT